MTAADEPLLRYRLAFSRIKGMTPMLAADILGKVDSEKAFFDCTERQLSTLLTTRSPILTDGYRSSLLAEADGEMRFIGDNGVTPLYITDEGYPRRLGECVDAPVMLYTLGQCDLNSRVMIGIVGTRHATVYGTRWVEGLVAELASRMAEKPVIVSGLAHGIDIAAHKAAMRHGLPTAAVLAHGLSTIYPAVHRREAAEMARGKGMLITEYTSSAPVHRGNFLARNRIVAGLCDCVIVVESAAKGGAMVTARLAREYDRDVFAVPGRVGDTYSAGCNALIARNVAALVDSADTLAAAMCWEMRHDEGTQESLPLDLSEDAQLILDHLRDNGDTRLNSLSIAVGRPIAKVMSALVSLEFKGLVISMPGGLYRPG